MLFAAILFLLGCSQINAYVFENSTKLGTAGDTRLVGGLPPAAGTYSWVVSIHDVSAAPTVTYKATGVAYSANWVITTDSAVSPTYTAVAADITKLAVYELGLNDEATVTGIRHRVKNFVQYTGRLTIKHDIIILRVCPPLTMTTFATLPPTSAISEVANIGAAATYVTYKTGLKEVTGRKVGHVCQCAAYTNYDNAFHFCLDEVDTNKVDATDAKAVVCVVGGNFAGLNVGFQDMGGEPYLDIFQYKSWLTTNAV